MLSSGKYPKRPILQARSWSKTPSGLTYKEQKYFFRISLRSFITYTHPSLNSKALLSHPLKSTFSVHFKGLGEYNVNFVRIRFYLVIIIIIVSFFIVDIVLSLKVWWKVIIVISFILIAKRFFWISKSYYKNRLLLPLYFGWFDKD